MFYPHSTPASKAATQRTSQSMWILMMTTTCRLMTTMMWVLSFGVLPLHLNRGFSTFQSFFVVVVFIKPGCLLTFKLLLKGGRLIMCIIGYVPLCTFDFNSLSHICVKLVISYCKPSYYFDEIVWILLVFSGTRSGSGDPVANAMPASVGKTVARAISA